MFGHSLTLFTAFGIKVKVNLSWTFIAIFIAWSLAKGFFPQVYAGLAPSMYWSMAVIALLGLAASIVLHEFAHSLVGRAFGMHVKSITLFMLGGVAELEDEPATPRAELVMALAGPAMSFTLAGLFALLEGLVEPSSPAFAAVLSYLAIINLVLAIFNLVPAFPMDGGRALRAILWAWRGDMGWATRIAARAGGVFGVTLMALGGLLIVSGAFVAGLWWVLIGSFVHGAARASVTQQASRQILTGHPVRRFMTTTPDVVSPDISLRTLIDEHMYRFHHDIFPVVDGASVLGVVGRTQLKSKTPDQWATTSVREVMVNLDAANTIAVEADAAEALNRMRKDGIGRLVVLDGQALAGIITLKDFLDVVALQMELEG